MNDLWDILLPVIVAAASGLSAIIIWVLNQMASRTAANREPKRQLYEELFQSVFFLCSMNHDTDEHVQALWALDRAWLFASRGVVQANMNFLAHYTKLRDEGDQDHLPRSDDRLIGLIHEIYAEMRKDLVPKPWYTLGLFEFPKIRGRLEFYEWSERDYDGLRNADQKPK